MKISKISFGRINTKRGKHLFLDQSQKNVCKIFVSIKESSYQPFTVK